MDKKQKIKIILINTIKDFLLLSAISIVTIAFLFGIGYLIYSLLNIFSIEKVTIIMMFLAILLVSLLSNINNYL